MAYYLVKAKPITEKLSILRAWLDGGEITQMRPFGRTLQDSLLNARIDRHGWAVWEEEDYCQPPLAQERAAVLDAHFTELSVKTLLQEDEGWAEIEHLPRLWEPTGRNP
jgi:hypothetical protein